MAELDLKIGTAAGSLSAVPSPVSYDIEYEDESESSAGRTESGKMYKKRKGTIRKISLTYENLSAAEGQQVFRAIQSEYVYARILDPFACSNVTSEFYVGNRKASLSPLNNGTWKSISFSLTERSFASLNA
ncbi:MAG: hypothetical protein IJU45_05935 [Clostridia bacterium]|nr:hypothetical protein [Clostridia bacterium]